MPVEVFRRARGRAQLGESGLPPVFGSMLGFWRPTSTSELAQGGAHLIDVVDRELGFSLRRAGRLSVEHLGVAIAMEVPGEQR